MEEQKIRPPAVAGQFYPESRQRLKNQIETLIDKEAPKSDIIACMLPHAGYMYSGRVAGQVISQVKLKDKIILLGPNHTGYGKSYSIMPEGLWQTPLGEVEIESNLAEKIINSSHYLEADFAAHKYEHSLEVELPLLQYFKDDFRIIPILLLSDEPEPLKAIGTEIANAVKECNLEDSTIIVASSDMTHYEPQEAAEKKDKEAIQAILQLNEDKLMDVILRLNVSMCGYAAVIAMISAAKLLGAKTGKLIKYETSGDITADRSSVVGYAGIIIY